MVSNFLLIAGCAFFIGILSIVLIARDNGIWIATGSWSTASGNVFVRTRIYSFCIFGWYPFVRLRLRYWARTPEYRALLATQIRELLHVQGVEGTWNHSPYQQGLYNGLEIATAVLEITIVGDLAIAADRRVPATAFANNDGIGGQGCR